LNAAQLNSYEQRWKRVFSVSAAVLVITLVCLVVWRPSGSTGFFAYTVGAVAVFVCLHAGKRLGDVDRVNAAVEGSWLREVHRPSDLDVPED
jgi:hypothetical protein